MCPTSMLRLASVIGLLLATSLPAPAQGEKPPVEGDALVHLLGRHRRSPLVQRVLAWEGPGLELRFAEDRVAGVGIRVAEGGGTRAFPGALPGGLPRTVQREQVRASAGWSQSGGETFVHRFSAAWHERPIEGFEMRVQFEGRTFAALEVVNDPGHVRAARSSIVQELVPATGWQSGHWPAALGADIATDEGALVTLWVGWSGGDTAVERDGLGVRVRDDRWIEELLFRPGFAGARPFDLPASVTVKDVEPRFGPPTGEGGSGVSSWHLVVPGAAPCDLVLQEGVGGTTVALWCDPAQVQAWQHQMLEDAPLSAAITEDLAQAWRLLRTDFERLKGAEQQQQGLLGATRWWHATQTLGGILGGTVHESPEDDVFPSRRVRYLLRRCGEAEGRTPRALIAPLEPAVAELLGEGWKLERREEAKGRPAASEWTIPDDDPFGGSPTVRLTATRVRGGFEVWIELSVPLDQ